MNCATCGRPRDNHPYRHPFVPLNLDDVRERLKQCAAGNSSYPQVTLTRGEAMALQAWIVTEKAAADVPYCKIHNRWPCADCGTSHFKGCTCYFCTPTSPNTSSDKP